jgi:hypothetical protein
MRVTAAALHTSVFMRPSAENPTVSGPAIDDARTPDAATPDMWADNCRDEVTLDQLSAGDRVIVTTRNNTYDILVTSWTGTVVVRGGPFFPEFTAARLAGSSLGGSSLKIRCISVGCPLEFVHGGRPVITTRVRTIRVVPVAECGRVM